MAQSSNTLHEPQERLDPRTVERHRAIVSLMEELEAVDWYDQRVDATSDPELRAVLAHNRDEEKEHAAMTLEWLRRNDPQLDEQLRAHLFREGSIAEEQHGDGEPGAGDAVVVADGSLGIGSLRPSRPEAA